ncbi:hypothetical protein [Nocardiopsis ansamitocini]|uniref:Uncharacterized protein n=1 Tax=Nocardiopsis ansamitocini TaxID=1670832 RepID=A0A9W6UIF6_9ACTN|nr:hypothetical protein [Nocardiopsis ansamitocini]GLU49891.1 hypothetical protein Nans01_42420 [Nocardiopsis ansamitocini]
MRRLLTVLALSAAVVGTAAAPAAAASTDLMGLCPSTAEGEETQAVNGLIGDLLTGINDFVCR